MQVTHNDNSTHVYLQACNGDSWIDVDPTWDSALGTVLPIAVWDGVSSTEIAVTPLHVYTLEESDYIMARQETEALEKDLAENRTFYHMLNQWLEEVRARP